MAESGNPLAPLRVCLLSGGASRRMGRDKALLPHPEGGCWLERTLRLLAALQAPITLLSRHPEHLRRASRVREAWGQFAVGTAATDVAEDGEPVVEAEPVVDADTAVEAEAAVEAIAETERQVAEAERARAGVDVEAVIGAALAAAGGVAPPPLEALAEPPPWEGPLLALHRLAQRYPNERLLLCPVDMPWLTMEALHTLLAASEAEPMVFQLAHDGERLQPLLGIYPSQTCGRCALGAAIAKGERRLQGWLAHHPRREVRLDAQALRNVNRPGEWWPD